MDEQIRKEKLSAPTGKVDVVLDTDAYNELDDQFAIAYLIRSSEKLNTVAINAAPFLNVRSVSPKDGMEQSYNEIKSILSLLNREDLYSDTFKGSGKFLKDEATPVISDAAKELVKRAMTYDDKSPLYVVAIGAITNIASAILMCPKIINRIVVVWLGGHSIHWPDTHEFNMYQDIAAARVVFNSGVPLVQLPCMGVASGFIITCDEFNNRFMGKNKLCDHLAGRMIEDTQSFSNCSAWSRPVWDVTAVAWLLNDNERFMKSSLMPTPIPEYNSKYSFDYTRPLYRKVDYINRDELLKDLIEKLTK